MLSISAPPVFKQVLEDANSPKSVSKKHPSSLMDLSSPQLVKNPTGVFTATNTITIACLAAYALTQLSEGYLLRVGALDMSKVFEGEVWRIATSTILHTGVFHLMSNLSGLRSIGPIIERKWGARGFAKIATLSTAVDILAKTVFNVKSSSVGFSGIIEFFRNLKF